MDEHQRRPEGGLRAIGHRNLLVGSPGTVVAQNTTVVTTAATHR
ncbi:hypothetical protein [Thermobifida halotolerans]|nr:hypothetical protein [Thermobifida halotolerans]